MKCVVSGALCVVALLAAGCAGSQTSSLERRLRALEDENFTLRQQVAERRSASAEVAETPSETPATTTSAPQKAAPRRQPVPVVVGLGGPNGMPLLSPTGGPSQHWGKLYAPPRVPGCSTGVFSLEIINQTDYSLRLAIDGREIVEGGASGTLPALPPGEHSYVCLESLGRHTISGRAYARRGSTQIEVNRFSIVQNYHTGSMVGERQMLWVDDTILNFY